MSVNAMAWALEQRTGSAQAKLLLVTLAAAAGGDGIRGVWTGRPDDLASRCELAPDEVWSYLRWLWELGLISRVDVRDGVETWVIHVGEPADLRWLELMLAPRPAVQISRRSGAAKISPSRRLEVYERDGYRCRQCGTSEDLTLDHIVARARGGGNEVENLQTLCRSCNSSKGARCHGPE